MHETRSIGVVHDRSETNDVRSDWLSIQGEEARNRLESFAGALDMPRRDSRHTADHGAQNLHD
jgi:hypothetical protein